MLNLKGAKLPSLSLNCYHIVDWSDAGETLRFGSARARCSKVEDDSVVRYIEELLKVLMEVIKGYSSNFR